MKENYLSVNPSLSQQFYTVVEKMDEKQYEEKITFPIPEEVSIRALYLTTQLPVVSDEKEEKIHFISKYENSIVLIKNESRIDAYRFINATDPPTRLNSIIDKRLLMLIVSVHFDSSDTLQHLLRGNEALEDLHAYIWKHLLLANPQLATYAPIRFFLLSEAGTNFKIAVKDLLNDLSHWIMQHWVGEETIIAEELSSKLDIFYEKNFHEFVGEKALNLFRLGIPKLLMIRNVLHADNTPLITRKRILREMIYTFAVCPEGIEGFIAAGYEKMASGLPYLLMGIRKDIAGQTILRLMREANYFNRYPVGNETHDVKSILNYYHHSLGIDESKDTYIVPVPKERPTAPGQQQELFDIAQKLNTVLRVDLTPESIINHLFIEHIDDMVSEFIRQVNEFINKKGKQDFDTIFRQINHQIDLFQDSLQFYGEDKNFTSDQILTEDKGEIKLLPERNIKQNLRLSLLKRLIQSNNVNSDSYTQIPIDQNNTTYLETRNYRYMLINSELPDTIPEDSILVKLAGHQLRAYRMLDGVLLQEVTSYPDQLTLSLLSVLFRSFNEGVKEIREIENADEFKLISQSLMYHIPALSLDYISVITPYERIPILQYIDRQYGEDDLVKIPEKLTRLLLGDWENLTNVLRNIRSEHAKSFYEEYNDLFAHPQSDSPVNLSRLPLNLSITTHYSNSFKTQFYLSNSPPFSDLARLLIKIPSSHYNVFLETCYDQQTLHQLLGNRENILVMMVCCLGISSWRDFLQTNIAKQSLSDIFNFDISNEMEMSQHFLRLANEFAYLMYGDAKKHTPEVQAKVRNLFEAAIPYFIEQLHLRKASSRVVLAMSRALVAEASQMQFIENYKRDFGAEIIRDLMSEKKLNNAQQLGTFLRSFAPFNRGIALSWMMSHYLKKIISSQEELIFILDLLSDKKDKITLLNKLGFEHIKAIISPHPFNAGNYLFKFKQDLTYSYIYNEKTKNFYRAAAEYASKHKFMKLSQEQIRLFLSSEIELTRFFKHVAVQDKITFIDHIGADYVFPRLNINYLDSDTVSHAAVSYLFDREPLAAFNLISQKKLNDRLLVQLLSKMEGGLNVGLNKLVSNGLAINDESLTQKLIRFCSAFFDENLYLILMNLQPDIYQKAIINKYDLNQMSYLIVTQPYDNLLRMGYHIIKMIGLQEAISRELVVESKHGSLLIHRIYFINTLNFYITNLETQESGSIYYFVQRAKTDPSIVAWLKPAIMMDPIVIFSIANYLSEKQNRLSFINNIQPDLMQLAISALSDQKFFLNMSYYSLETLLDMFTEEDQFEVTSNMLPFDFYMLSDKRTDSLDSTYQNLNKNTSQRVEEAIRTFTPTQLKYVMATHQNDFQLGLFQLSTNISILNTLLNKIGNEFFIRWGLKDGMSLEASFKMANLSEKDRKAWLLTVCKLLLTTIPKKQALRFLERFNNNIPLYEEALTQYYHLNLPVDIIPTTRSISFFTETKLPESPIRTEQKTTHSPSSKKGQD